MLSSEFLTLCTQQVRSQKMRPSVERELRAHIEDQKQAYLDAGKSEEDAEELAVRQMGDPIEAGLLLDRVHRPRMDWKAFACILTAALAGLALQFCLLREGGSPYFFSNFLKSWLVGIALMTGICFVDYTILGMRPRTIWCCVLLLFFAVYLLSEEINGSRLTSWVTVLFIPAYSGILFCYRGQGWQGLFKAIFWPLFTAPILFFLGNSPFFTCTVVLGSCLLQLVYAVAKGWLSVPKWVCAPLLALPAALASALFGYLALFSHGYRGARIRALFLPYSAVDSGSGYILTNIRREVLTLLPFGPSGHESELWSSLVSSEEYTLLTLMRYLGFLPGLAIAALLTALFGWLLVRAVRQPNRLGALVGAGSCYAGLILTLFHVLINLGLMLSVAAGLPLLSAGGRFAISFYALLGLLLSVFRNTTSLPEPETESQKRSPLGHWKLRVSIERVK